MSELRIEKTPLRVRLLLAEGGSLEATLFLAAQSPLHSGAQTVAELMSEGDRMLPFHDPAGQFLLLGKAGVAALTIADQEPTADELLEKIPVSLRMAGGHLLRGHYLAEKGAGTRLSDALNADDPWFRLEYSGSLAWVSKNHLVTVEPG